MLKLKQAVKENVTRGIDSTMVAVEVEIVHLISDN